MDHLDAIVVIKNVVNTDFCKRIINITKNRAQINLKVGDEEHLVKKIRDVKGYHLNFNTPTNLFYWNYVKDEIERLYSFYKAKFPLIKNNKVEQIDLLKYTIGGKYNVHTDNHTNYFRTLSVIINLNDSYEGGDLVFCDQNKNEIKRFNLGKGSIVFFPGNFMYPHAITPITKGTRYSIVAWLQ